MWRQRLTEATCYLRYELLDVILHAGWHDFACLHKSLAFGGDGPHKIACIQAKHSEAIVIVSNILSCVIKPN